MAQNIASPVYPAEQVYDLLEIPVAREKLRAVGSPPEPGAGITLFHPGVSIRNLRANRVIRKRNLIWLDRALLHHPVIKAGGKSRYLHVSLPLPTTGGMTRAAQIAAIRAGGDRPAPVCTAVLAWLIHFLATDEALYVGGWMRCASPLAEIRPYCDEIDINLAYGEEEQLPFVGMASVRPAHVNLAF
jgi:hypothetical protein